MTCNKKVAFVLCRYPLGISAMIVNSIKLFNAKGIAVDIYLDKQSLEACPVTFPASNIRTFIFDDKGFGIFFKSYRFLMRNFSNSLYPVLKLFSLRLSLMFAYPEVYRFASWIKNITKFDHYDYVFPVDCFSLLSLYDISNKDKLVYFNMELLDWHSENAVYGNKLILKNLEYHLIQSLQNVVLPSPARAELFCKINNFSSKKIQILPVAAMGNPIAKKSRYFRDLFSIPDNHIIVLYAGNFTSWFQCIEIIDALRSCKIPYSLVMHTWSKDSTNTKYFQEMVKLAAGLPVFFSSDYINVESLTDALSSADIGLAFYESIDDNCTEILFSSNKIGEYLKAGLPVITSNHTNLHNFVYHNKIGSAVPVQDIARAVEEISCHLHEYKSNAIECYNFNYRFESYFENFYRLLYLLEKPENIHAT